MIKSLYTKSSLYFFIFFLWLSVTPIASFAAWTTEAVDAPKYFSSYPPQRAIAVDNSDHPHIAYGGDHLYHAYFNGTQWQYETADSDWGVGLYTSIAIDSNNKVHISYLAHGTNAELKYATNASGSWVTQNVDSAGNPVGNTSIAIDSNNRVHISYCYHDGTNRYLKYATNASGSWVTQTVDSAGDVGSSNSIAIDSNNKVHLSYYDQANRYLKYATNASGSWVTQTVDSTGYVASSNSIAIDSNNRVHISYCYDDGTNRYLKYATNASGLWVTQTVDSGWYVGSSNSIAIDSDNKVHISYYDQINADLKYATNDVLDTTAPTTTALPQGGTYSSAQSVTLTCNDGSGSGCKTTYYCLGSACNPTTIYSGSINISSSTDLRFYSKDNANNSEQVKTEVYTIRPIVECNFVPDATTIHRGGTLGFQAAVTNNTDAVQVFKFATRITKPSGGKYSATGYLKGPLTVNLGPHGSISRHLSQYIPYSAPLGTYIYHGYVGVTGNIYDECQFQFTVTQ